MQVGFIGLGIMGASMAANLQKAGYQLVVHDIREASATSHLSAGAKWTESPKSVAAQSEVIFTSLPGPPEVETVALGSNRLIEGIEKKTISVAASVREGQDSLVMARACRHRADG